jgi:uncharacterized membrane protein
MTELTNFVEKSLSTGHSRDEVRAVLSGAGWPRDEIDHALAGFKDESFPIPVPSRRTSSAPREGFLYFVTFFTLCIWAFSVVTLLLGYVDKLPPVDTNNNGSTPDALNWSISGLVVAFPVYLLLTIGHLRSYSRDPERRTSQVRRQWSYLTLAVASITVVLTLLNMVAYLLGPNTVQKPFLKYLVLIAVAGVVFGFYSWEVRRGDFVKDRG